MKRIHLAVTALSVVLSMGLTIPAFAEGFVSTSQGVKYQWGSGDYCTNNWVRYKDHWFYFGNDQLMRTGWIQRDDTWYYTADTGELQGGIMKINGNVYYFDTYTMKMLTGPYTYNGVTSTYSENGTTDGAPYVYEEWDSYGNIIRGKKFGVR